MRLRNIIVALLSLLLLLPDVTLAQERINSPYFVTYNQYMEEPGALEVLTVPILGRAHNVNTFWSNWTEFEYGARRWWSTALYLDSQHTKHEGSLFTGFRIENRFRPFLEEHRVNPVFYFEWEHVTEADKIIKEVVGFEGKEDFMEPNSVTRHEHEQELEAKLILGGQIGQWNLAGNFISEKDVISARPWAFGYAAGLSRPLAASTGRRCTYCRESVVAGVEVYGGLGVWSKFTVRGTSQYIAPVILWSLPTETTFRFSPGWGLTDNSLGTIFRFGVSQEVEFADWIRKALHRH
jgi:hypothetical protein